MKKIAGYRQVRSLNDHVPTPVFLANPKLWNKIGRLKYQAALELAAAVPCHCEFEDSDSNCIPCLARRKLIIGACKAKAEMFYVRSIATGKNFTEEELVETVNQIIEEGDSAIPKELTKPLVAQFMRPYFTGLLKEKASA